MVISGRLRIKLIAHREIIGAQRKYFLGHFYFRFRRMKETKGILCEAVEPLTQLRYEEHSFKLEQLSGSRS
jgi:hypothetical protein